MSTWNCVSIIQNVIINLVRTSYIKTIPRLHTQILALLSSYLFWQMSLMDAALAIRPSLIKLFPEARSDSFSSSIFCRCGKQRSWCFQSNVTSRRTTGLRHADIPSIWKVRSTGTMATCWKESIDYANSNWIMKMMSTSIIY